MTRKDYKLVSIVLHNLWVNPNRSPKTDAILSHTIGAFAAAMEKENPRFDKAKFYSAVFIGTKDPAVRVPK